MKKVVNILAILLVGTCIVMAGCEDDEVSTHDVTIGWNISNMDVCSQRLEGDYLVPDAGPDLIFNDVVVQLYENQGDDDSFDRATEDCNSFQTTFHNLERGDYFVTVEAMADYDGVELPYFQSDPDDGNIVVPSVGDEPYDFRLELGTGKVMIEWGFEKGVCSANDVSKLHITLQGGKSHHSHVNENVLCDSAEWLVEGVEWDTYSIEIEGYAADGTRTLSGSTTDDFKVRPGEYIGESNSDDRSYIVLK
jgi:hypothetical protein